MKVAMFVPEIINCGPLNVVFNILRGLENQALDFIIISVRKSENRAYLKKISKEFLAEFYYLDDYSDHISGLNFILNHEKVDILHSHGYYPDKLSSSLVFKNVKKISTIHCMLYHDYPKEYGFLKGYLGAFLHFQALRKGNFDYIVSCSNSVYNYCEKFLDKSNLITINNGVDQNKYFILDSEEKIKYREYFGYSDHKIYIYAGRFIRRKKVPELLKYFKDNSSTDSLLLLLGDGPEKMECEKAFSSQNIKFLGQVDDPSKYYQISDFVISNSDAEGYPMSIIEAVSCGCYALLSDIPSHQEFIENNPLCSSCIEQIVLKDFKPFNFNKNIVNKLSAKYMAKQYLAIYSD